MKAQRRGEMYSRHQLDKKGEITLCLLPLRFQADSWCDSNAVALTVKIKTNQKASA
ncbi:MAG: hypothetical protein F6K31_22430 [Symploca sp. SIO2G7]|nr:hypothetical protein [Symploca sp. SIO2G7]